MYWYGLFPNKNANIYSTSTCFIIYSLIWAWPDSPGHVRRHIYILNLVQCDSLDTRRTTPLMHTYVRIYMYIGGAMVIQGRRPSGDIVGIPLVVSLCHLDRHVITPSLGSTHLSFMQIWSWISLPPTPISHHDHYRYLNVINCNFKINLWNFSRIYLIGGLAVYTVNSKSIIPAV